MAQVRIGILGGTFNPIHLQHLKLAECAYRQLELDKILLIPSGVSYLKSGTGVLPADVRYSMCALAVRDIPYIELSDIEIRRKGNSYTCDTIRELVEADPGASYYFITGSDTFLMLDSWRSPEYIFRHCVIAVVARADEAGSPDEEILSKIKEYESRFDAEVRILEKVPSDLSSSMIRDAASRGEDISGYVPERVAEYIINNRLYR